MLLSAPDALQEAITLCQSVEGVVALAHGADETAESVDLVLAGVSAVLVDLSDGDLDGGVVLGLNDAVGGAALAWDETVKIAVLATSNPSFYSRADTDADAEFRDIDGNWRIECRKRGRRGRREDEQVHEFSLIVLHFCGVEMLI